MRIELCLCASVMSSSIPNSSKECFMCYIHHVTYMSFHIFILSSINYFLLQFPNLSLAIGNEQQQQQMRPQMWAHSSGGPVNWTRALVTAPHYMFANTASATASATAASSGFPPQTIRATPSWLHQNGFHA